MRPYRPQHPASGQSRGARSANATARGQPIYYAGGGLPVAPPPGRHGNVTPVSGLSFEVRQYVWLKNYVSEAFPGGHIVQITGYEQQLPSPTARSNQSAEWQRGDHDTVYRFKRAQVQPRTKILSPDQFHPPHHDQLSPENGGQPGATQYWTNSLVYLRNELYCRLPDSGNRSEYSIKVPRGTQCSVLSNTGRSGGVNYTMEITSGNTGRCYYALRAKYWYESVVEAASSHKKEFHNFREATQAEINDYLRRLGSLRPPVVVDWNQN